MCSFELTCSRPHCGSCIFNSIPCHFGWYSTCHSALDSVSVSLIGGTVVEYKMRTGFQIWDYLRALFNFPSLQSDAQGKTCSYADRLVWCHCFALKTEKKKKKKKKKSWTRNCLQPCLLLRTEHQFDSWGCQCRNRHRNILLHTNYINILLITER